MKNVREIRRGTHQYQPLSLVTKGGGLSRGDTPLLSPLYRVLHRTQHRVIATLSTRTLFGFLFTRLNLSERGSL